MNRKESVNHPDDVMPSLQKTAGFLIRELRIAKKMSGLELGRILNVSQQQISRYERGETELTLDKINKISSVFDLSIWQFIDVLSYIHEEKCNKKNIPYDCEYDKNLWWGNKKTPD
ncbi:helix-turn-helix transcriptional regulator [Morganella morganii]|uniref:helix-turn-helix domain-containing protein n=1 Tax=Morganella morganii TaxID=582 RepID=UPI0032DB6D3A